MDCPLLTRGVYRANCFGPNGETILLAVDYRHRLIEGGRCLVPVGDDLTESVAALWRLLDTVDAEHARRRQPRDKPLSKAG